MMAPLLVDPLRHLTARQLDRPGAATWRLRVPVTALRLARNSAARLVPA